MKVKAAVLYAPGTKYEIEEITLDPPKEGEVLVKYAASGMCHSDEHLVTGDMVPSDEVREERGLPEMFPIIGGHPDYMNARSARHNSPCAQKYLVPAAYGGCPAKYGHRFQGRSHSSEAESAEKDYTEVTSLLTKLPFRLAA